jgi:hypothetical protein
MNGVHEYNGANTAAQKAVSSISSYLLYLPIAYEVRNEPSENHYHRMQKSSKSTQVLL